MVVGSRVRSQYGVKMFALDAYLDAVLGKIMPGVGVGIKEIFASFTTPIDGELPQHIGYFAKWKKKILASELVFALEGEQPVQHVMQFVSMILNEKPSVLDGSKREMLELTKKTLSTEYLDIVRVSIQHVSPDINFEEEFVIAAAEGKRDVVAYLLDEQPGRRPPVERHRWGFKKRMVGSVLFCDRCPVLTVAAGNGRLEVVRYLLDERYGVRSDIHEMYEAPLRYAAIGGHLHIVRFLVEERQGEKADISYLDDLLLHAVSGGNVDIVAYMLDNGAPIDIGYEHHQSPLCEAVRYGYLDVVRYLLDERSGEKADIHQYNNTVAFIAAKNGHLEVLKFLLDERQGNNGDRISVTVRSTSFTGYPSLLEIAAINGHVNIVRYLLDERPGQHLSNRINHALFRAVLMDRFDVVKILLEERHGEKAHIHYEHDLLLRCAAGNGHLRIVKYLLFERNGEKADIHAFDEGPLIAAIIEGHYNVVRFLLTRKDKPDVSMEYNQPIKLAIENGRVKILNLLLEHGANADDAECLIQQCPDGKVVRLMANTARKHNNQPPAKRARTAASV